MKHGAGAMPLDYVQKKYDQTDLYPFYPEMKALGTKVLGVWDDHDYGVNDGGSDYPHKKLTREMFLNFVGEPLDSARRLDKDSPIH